MLNRIKEAIINPQSTFIQAEKSMIDWIFDQVEQVQLTHPSDPTTKIKVTEAKYLKSPEYYQQQIDFAQKIINKTQSASEKNDLLKLPTNLQNYLQLTSSTNQ
jgi:hypothetical protein